MPSSVRHWHYVRLNCDRFDIGGLDQLPVGPAGLDQLSVGSPVMENFMATIIEVSPDRKMCGLGRYFRFADTGGWPPISTRRSSFKRADAQPLSHSMLTKIVGPSRGWSSRTGCGLCVCKFTKYQPQNFNTTVIFSHYCSHLWHEYHHLGHWYTGVYLRICDSSLSNPTTNLGLCSQSDYIYTIVSNVRPLPSTLIQWCIGSLLVCISVLWTAD